MRAAAGDRARRASSATSTRARASDTACRLVEKRARRLDYRVDRHAFQAVATIAMARQRRARPARAAPESLLFEDDRAADRGVLIERCRSEDGRYGHAET